MGRPQFFSPEEIPNRATTAATMPFISPAIQSFAPSEEGTSQAPQTPSRNQQSESSGMGPTSSGPRQGQSSGLFFTGGPQIRSLSPSSLSNETSSSATSNDRELRSATWRDLYSLQGVRNSMSSLADNFRTPSPDFHQRSLQMFGQRGPVSPVQGPVRALKEEEIHIETLIEFLRNNHNRNRGHPRVWHNRDGTSSLSLDTRVLRRHLQLPGRRQNENERRARRWSIEENSRGSQQQVSWSSDYDQRMIDEEQRRVDSAPAAVYGDAATNQAEREANISPPAAANSPPNVTAWPIQPVLAVRLAGERTRLQDSTNNQPQELLDISALVSVSSFQDLIDDGELKRPAAEAESDNGEPQSLINMMDAASP